MALKMEKRGILCGDLLGKSVVPDILTQENLQNKTRFDLSEYDEIYEAYGQRDNGYPYRRQDLYLRQLRERKVDMLVLENEHLRAEFLPGFGGRLWRLWDRDHQRELVYVNDCIRPSNLAVRDAWFSGGVEWNCGIIGHSPYTMERIFAARVEAGDRQILRLYGYERVRRVVFQMDFWLDADRPALNCHVSISNPNEELTPMYWWSNIASPLYPGGRILVPAHKAYTWKNGVVVKQEIPCPEPGIDVSHYETIPTSRDFFFENDPDTERWIAHTDASGFGLLHSSTSRLQSRKLFVWGQKPGGHHWQRFLTEQAGEYLEIQAGLGKTQYGCIPMAPNTTWEWTERYEPVQLTREQMALDFSEASRQLDRKIRREGLLEMLDREGRSLRTLPSEVLFRGTCDGSLQNALREKLGQKPLRSHLDFSSPDPSADGWKKLLKDGVLPAPGSGRFPEYDPIGREWIPILERSLEEKENRNWYGYYCLGLLYREENREDLARRYIQKSLSLQQTASGEYAMAVLELEQERKKQTCQHICQGLSASNGDLSYAKAAIRLLSRCQNWRLMIREIQLLPRDCRENSRIRLYEAFALVHLGRPDQARSILNRGLELEDVREGEDQLGELWHLVCGEDAPVPEEFDFAAL